MLKFGDKVPEDRVKREIVWTDWLEEGDSLLLDPAPVLQVMVGEAVVVDPDILLFGPLVSSDQQSVIFWIEGGVAGQIYEIACTIHTEATDETVTRRGTQKVKVAI